jgi:hypothetical protein
MTGDEELAAMMAGAVWEAVQLSGGLEAVKVRHFGARIDRAVLGALPVPLPSAGTLPAGRSVSMADGRHVERHDDEGSLRAAYHRWPRTRVMDIGYSPAEGWAYLARKHVTWRAGAGEPVVIGVVQTEPGDTEPGGRRAKGLRVIAQVSGDAGWRAGEGLTGMRPDDVQQGLLAPGDLLVVPGGLPYATQACPGRSVQLVFAFPARSEDTARW